MNLGRFGRRGQADRQDTPTENKQPARPAFAAGEPGEYDGNRRSVFDLLKEKHPDLADPEAKKAAKAPFEPPASFEVALAIEPPPAPVEPPAAPIVEPFDPQDFEPLQIDELEAGTALAEDVPREEPPAAEPPRSDPSPAELPRVEPPPEEKPPEPAIPPMRAAAAAPVAAPPVAVAPPAAVAPIPAPIPIVAPKPVAVAPPVATLPTPAPPKKQPRPRRSYALPPKKVALFWSAMAAVFVLGAYGLASLKPSLVPAPAGTVVPVDSAAGALSVRDVSLEPEKVMVPVPNGAAPAATAPPKTPAKIADTKVADTKVADSKPLSRAEEKKREREAKKKAADQAAKKEAPIVIEQVPPVVAPVRVGGRQPEYPVEAQSAGVEGKVVLFGVIDRTGKVKNARVVRGLSPPLDAAALAAFRTWRFKPATQKGKKVEFKYNAGIEFRINQPVSQLSEPQVAALTPAATPLAAASASLPPALVANAGAPPAAGSPVGSMLAYGGNFTPPVRITMVWPQKPPSAQMVKGEVKLQLAVGADGNVREVEVIEGLPQGVTEAAIDAVRQWKFKPARQSGEPVAVYHRVSLRF